MKRTWLSVLLAAAMAGAVGCGSGEGGAAAPSETVAVAPAPSRSPSVVQFCVMINEVRSHSSLLIQRLAFEEPGAAETGAQLSRAVESAARTAPDDVLEQFLDVRAEWLRIESVLEGAEYDGDNMQQADKDEVTAALESIVDEVLGPLLAWTNQHC